MLLLGLDAVGKTTLLWQMQRLSSSTATIETSTPTIGMNVEQLEMGGLRFVSWDVGGSDKVRPLWHHYFQITQGLIFVVDASDLDRRDIERRELQQLLSDEIVAFFKRQSGSGGCLQRGKRWLHSSFGGIFVL